MKHLFFLVLLAVFGSGSLAMAEGSAPTVHGHADAPGINWFAGDVPQAFAAARSSHKPILLYWGAIWCPPCQQLKSTVFSRADFIARSRLFVPVYLDGDEAGAQKWGEKFQVAGYPTVVVLDASQHELMRIAGGLDLGAYATVLDTALAALQPIDALLTSVAAGKTLELAQCRRLAYNGWALDDLAASGKAARAQQLVTAAAHCPARARLESARLQVIAASYAADAEAQALKEGRAPSKALRTQMAAVSIVLDRPREALALADALQYLDDSYFAAIKADGATAAPWLAKYARVMDAATRDPSHALADQLGASYAKLSAIKAIDGSVPADVARDARAQLDVALAGQQIPYVRSGVINAALGIFDVLDQNEEAYRVVQGELDKTATPYYYKADLGDLAEGLGRKDEALKWFSEAYAESQGAATRFQWGAMYAGSLLRLQPDDAGRISSVTAEVLGELDGPDRIYRRARMRLERLDAALRKWDEAAQGSHHDVLLSLRERMQQICVKIPQDEPARGSCDAFLDHA
jgi:thiol-disulfide isomerase/thioredoxin